MTTLYLLSGLAFSGKSTLAEKLASYLNIRLVSFDSLWVKHEQEIPKGKDGWRFIRQIAKKEITAYLKKGQSVVFDDTNPRKEHRDEFKKIARQTNAQPVLIYVDTPVAIIRERMKTNLKDPQRHDVTEENFHNNLQQLEKPAPDEKPLIFSYPDSIEDWLIRNFPLHKT